MDGAAARALQEKTCEIHTVIAGISCFTGRRSKSQSEPVSIRMPCGTKTFIRVPRQMEEIVLKGTEM